MQYFLVVKECIFVLMEIITIDIEKDDAADLDLRESLYLKLINSENTKDSNPDFDELEKFDCIPHFKEANNALKKIENNRITCLLYTSPSPRDRTRSRMPSSA